ncbi:geranylgeranyl reductase [Thermodesulfovibrio aggregans]|uniref:Geranylgeranyl diphosphate reductase n=1 Tax=Thermodesulfovibrio aggregans TaxID=86166 RepID=A0A0U9HRA5_9BACT|nr:NAD(P)/FAD-dependent oxidoreductase [Thermodesulfovibrio aggregans]GAQ95575.1 geranylgeranyl reductase [Thermodesulfovibrio aggregans]
MKCQVLVVGGGPAGSTAARLLAEKGIETVLIEKNLSFNKPCGGGIPSAGLKEFFILDKIQKEVKFNTVTKVKIVPPFSEPIEVSLKNGEILIFNRYNFDSFLRKLSELQGAKVIEGELTNIEKVNNKIKSTVKDKKGKVFQINSDYLIAADGVNSKVCTLIGTPKPDYYWTVSLHIPINSRPKDTCEFWFGNSHASFFYSWVFPGTDYLSVGTGSEDIRKLKVLIETFIKKRFTMTLNSFTLRAYKIPRWRKRKFFKNNILFCGDALGTVMPVSFEGIYYSMKSAQFASEAIIQKDLKLYEKLWNDNFLMQFTLMKKFQDFMFGNDERMDRWLNIHRDPAIQELAMALWLRKENGTKLIPLYLKAFGSFISRIAPFKIK